MSPVKGRSELLKEYQRFHHWTDWENSLDLEPIVKNKVAVKQIKYRITERYC